MRQHISSFPSAALHGRALDFNPYRDHRGPHLGNEVGEPRRHACRGSRGVCAVVLPDRRQAASRKIRLFTRGQPGGGAGRCWWGCSASSRLARDNLACRTKVACSHVSGKRSVSSWDIVAPKTAPVRQAACPRPGAPCRIRRAGSTCARRLARAPMQEARAAASTTRG